MLPLKEKTLWVDFTLQKYPKCSLCNYSYTPIPTVCYVANCYIQFIVFHTNLLCSSCPLYSSMHSILITGIYTIHIQISRNITSVVFTVNLSSTRLANHIFFTVVWIVIYRLFDWLSASNYASMVNSTQRTHEIFDVQVRLKYKMTKLLGL